MVEYFNEKYLQKGVGSSDFINPSLDKVLSIYNTLLKEKSFKEYIDNTFSIVIAGTNGKGSTSSYLALLLSKLDLRIGLYTSPHLVEILERIQILNSNIENKELDEYIKDIIEIDKNFEGLSYFEKLTLIAVYSFFRKKTDINIYEVGMGGRWDATNVFPAKISVITSIGMDHMQYLGDSVDKIFLEKAGIIKGDYLFWGDLSNVSNSVLSETKNKCLKEKIRVFEYGNNYSIIDENSYRINLDDGIEYELNFPQGIRNKPEVFKKNFILSVSIFLKIIKEREKIIPTTQELRNFLDFDYSSDMYIILDSFHTHKMIDYRYKHSYLPVPLCGRYQTINLESNSNDDIIKEKKLIIDVGHNEDGALSLYSKIKEEYDKNPSLIKFPGIVSILKDKDYHTVFKILKKILDPILVFQSSSARSISQKDLEGIDGTIFYPNIDSLWQENIDKYDKFVVCGSVYGVGEVLRYLDIYPNRIFSTLQRKSKD